LPDRAAGGAALDLRASKTAAHCLRPARRSCACRADIFLSHDVHREVIEAP